MQLVYIEWVDSYGCASEWTPIDPYTPELLHCQSVGWLLHDGQDCKVIIPHLSQASHSNASQQGCGDMTIPTAAITKIVPITISSS
jgi:hypothetical protein